MLLPFLLNNLVSQPKALGIDAFAGLYSIGGNSVSFKHSYILLSSDGLFNLNGLSASTKKSINPLLANSSTYSIVGLQSFLRNNKLLFGQIGSYQFASINSEFTYNRIFTASQASYIYSGISADFSVVKKLIASQSQFEISGISNDYIWLHVLGGNPGGYVLNSQTAAILLNVPNEEFNGFLNTISRNSYLSNNINKVSALNSINSDSWKRDIVLNSFSKDSITD